MSMGIANLATIGSGCCEDREGGRRCRDCLPISWERTLADNPSFAHYYPDPGTNKIVYREEVCIGYRGYEHNATVPLFPFGYMSYTTFAMSGLKVESEEDGYVLASFTVQPPAWELGQQQSRDNVSAAGWTMCMPLDQ